MITALSHPEDIRREVDWDYNRSHYWFVKHFHGNNGYHEKGQEMASKREFYAKDYLRSELIEYRSPKTGNLWLSYNIATESKERPGWTKVTNHNVCYYETGAYMGLLTRSISVNEDGRDVLTIIHYTPHMFMRFATRMAEQGHSLDMTDRRKIAVNFCENYATSIFEVRTPHKNRKKKDRDIVVRLPASFIRGDMYRYDDHTALMTFRTFYTDATLTDFQREDLEELADYIDNKKYEQDNGI